MAFLFINKTSQLNNLKTRTSMNTQISVFLIAVETIIYLLIYNYFRIVIISPKAAKLKFASTLKRFIVFMARFSKLTYEYHFYLTLTITINLVFWFWCFWFDDKTVAKVYIYVADWITMLLNYLTRIPVLISLESFFVNIFKISGSAFLQMLILSYSFKVLFGWS